ncbi:MAG: MFS transporter [Catenulispora sp.]|nr:MFS transporter [Catenulispora sp.]NUR60023.1 MFS transporter [Catenulispora sp.]
MLCLAQFMLIIDITVVNVALPSIARDLSLGDTSLTWVVAAYSLCFGGLLLLGGRLADGLGRRRTFLLGLGIFTAASLASGLATSGGMLITARAAQGVGAALLSPAAMSIITTTFHGSERNRALGVWGAIGGSGAALGVLLGGALTAGPGWAWVFYINVPIGAAVFALVPTVVPSTPGDGLRGLDLRGAVTVTATAALGIYGLIQAGHTGWGSISALVPLCAAAAAAVVFVVVEHAAEVPLVRLSLLARRQIADGVTAMLGGSTLLLTGFFLISLDLQRLLGYSALRTGLAFLPVTVATVAGAHLAAHAIGHLGFRRVAATGFTLAGIGAALMARIPRDAHLFTDVVPGFVLLAMGAGAVFVSASISAMHQVDHREAGLVSGIVNTGHELGAALGVALASALAVSSLAAGSVHGLRTAFTVAYVLALTAAVLSLRLLPAGRPDPSAAPVFGH